MDIVGVPGVEAEAEVLSAITLLLQRLKLSAQEIVIKVGEQGLPLLCAWCSIWPFP